MFSNSEEEVEVLGLVNARSCVYEISQATVITGQRASRWGNVALGTV